MSRGPVADGRAPMDGYGGGVWGRGYDPFLLSCSEDGEVTVPAAQTARWPDARAVVGSAEGLVAELDQKQPPALTALQALRPGPKATRGRTHC